MGNQMVKSGKKGTLMPEHAPLKVAIKPQQDGKKMSKIPTGKFFMRDLIFSFEKKKTELAKLKFCPVEITSHC